MRYNLPVQLRSSLSIAGYAGGGTPTPTPPPVVVPAIIYSSADEEFQITNTASLPGATWQWYDASDDSPIVGETSATLALADAPLGEFVYVVANGNPAQTSNQAIAGPSVISYFLDPADPTYAGDNYYLCSKQGDGTPITPSVAGWDYYGYDFEGPPPMSKWVGIRDGYLQQLEDQGGGFGFIGYTTTSSVYNAVFTVPPLSGVQRVRFIAAGYETGFFSSEQIEAYAEFDRGALTISCAGFNGNAMIFEAPSPTVTFAAGDQFTLRIDLDAEVVIPKLNGVPITGTGDGTFTGLDNTGGNAQHFGLMPSGGIANAGTNICSILGWTDASNENLYKIGDEFFPPDIGVDPYCVFTYGYQGTVSTVRWAVVSADGVPLLGDWQTSATAGDGTGTVQFDTPAIEGLTDTQLAIEIDGTPESITLLPIGAVPYYPSLDVTEWGQQADNMYIYSAEAFNFANNGLLGAWQGVDAGNGSVEIPLTEDYWNEDGYPTGKLPPTAVALQVGFFDTATPGYEQGGSYLATWDMPGYSTVSWQIGFGCTAGSINTGAKTAQLDDVVAGQRLNVGLRLTPDNPLVLPTGGMRVDMFRIGETETDGLSDKAFDDYASGQWIRFMKWNRTEDLYYEISGGTGLRQYPFATGTVMGQVIAQRSAKGHICLPVNATDDFATQLAEELLAEVAPGTDFLFELGNELDFNILYYQQRNYASWQAAEGGYIADCPAGTYGNYKDNGVNSATGETEITIATGEKFFCATSYQAKMVQNVSGAPIAPGATVPNQPAGYNDGTFEILAGSPEIDYGTAQWRLARLIALGSVLRVVLEPTCNVKLGHGSWQNADPDYVVSTLLEGGTGTEYCRSIDYVMPASYIEMNIDWPTAPSWVTGYADQAAFNAGLLAYSAPILASTITTLTNYNYGIYNGLRSAGIPSASCPKTWCYEGNYSMYVSNIPAPDQVGFNDAVQAFGESSDAYDWMTDYLEGIKGIGLAGNIFFARHGGYFAGSLVSYFGIETFVNAGNDPIQGPLDQRNVAWNDFVATL